MVLDLALRLALTSTMCGAMSCDDPPRLRAPSVRRCVVEVRYQPPHWPSSLEVELEGRRASLSLLDREAGDAGLWGADLWTSAGWQSYTLRLDGRALTDPQQPLSITRTTAQGPQERSLVRVPDCQRGRWFRVSSKLLPKRALFTLAYERGLSDEQRLSASREGETPSGIGLDPRSLTVEVSGAPQPFQLEGELISLDLNQLTLGKHHLKISGRDQSGVEFETFHAPFWIEEQPHRWTRGVMYQVVLDRLSPPLPLAETEAEMTPEDLDRITPSIGERWGGSLESVSALLKSGYFERLGVSTLWLSPLSPNPEGLWTGVEGGAPRYEGYHGYWSIGARQVGAEWGGEEALREVVSLAHARGIRVIVDVALNHVHEQHPYVTEHPEWFSPPGCLCGRPGCDWGTYIETCRFTTYLPDIRWEGIEVMERQVDDAAWWIEQFNLDGLRVDAVPMMPRSVTRMLSAEVRRRFEGLRTRHLLIGETFTGPREWTRIGWYLGPDGLDGQFDFPWMWALREVLAWESEPMWTLLEAWRTGESTWGDAGALMGLFVGNHDVTRFVSEAARDDLSDPWEAPPLQTDDPEALDRLWVAISLTFTLPGIPVLYYGDETGLSGANDPDNRRPLWPLGSDAPSALSTQRAAHFERVARLGRLRACLPALATPESKVRFLATETERLSFSRGAIGQEVIVVAQRQPALESTQLTLLSPPSPEGQRELWVDALSGEVLNEEVSERDPRFVQLTLPPQRAHSVRLLMRRDQLASCQELSL